MSSRNKKKIGIMTFHRALNYGAVLQTYALCSFLMENGFMPEIIDFVSSGHSSQTALLHKLTIRKQLKARLLNIINVPYMKKRRDCFDSFMMKYLPLSEVRSVAENSLEQVCLSYYTIICGSDQIWNPRLLDSSEAFFLPYDGDYKRIAYSASIGNGNLTDYKHPDLVHDSLLKFDHISVREKTTYDNIINFIGHDHHVDITIDPTLLMDRKPFLEIADNSHISTPYIFLYTVVGRKQTIEAAERLAQRTGLPVYTLFPGRAKRWWIENRTKLPKGNVGPERFLALIRDASYVVTDSYHGSVFSLQFQKPFFMIKKEENGVQYRDERIGQLCEDFGIENRYISADEIALVPLDSVIDWSQIEERRAHLAENSRSYLLHALSK